jgi:hypothetical protein
MTDPTRYTSHTNDMQTAMKEISMANPTKQELR